MRIIPCSFPIAVQHLAEHLKINIPQSPVTPEEKEKKPLYSLLNEAHTVFLDSRSNPKVLEFINKRGISSEALDKYGIGYAPRDFSFLTSKLKGYKLPLAKKIGLISQKENRKSQYDFFVDRLIFPVRNEAGNIAGYGGRALQEEQKCKYLNSIDSPVFNKHKLLFGLFELLQVDHRPEHIVVVEGFMDVIACSDQKIYNAAAAMGTEVTNTHLDILYRYTDNLIFLFDGDKAGTKAAAKMAHLGINRLCKGKTLKLAFLPSNEDPDSLIRGGKGETVLGCINVAVCASDFLIEEIRISTGNFNSTASKASACEKFKSILSEMPASFFKELYIVKFCEIIGLNSNKCHYLYV